MQPCGAAFVGWEIFDGVVFGGVKVVAGVASVAMAVVGEVRLALPVAGI